MYYIIFFAVIILAAVYSCCAKAAARLSSARDLCMLALLIAITALLAVYGTVRIGAGIKISFKFISVFLTAAFFGPLWGGAVAAVADVIAFFINPVGGVFMPQITMVEFLHGFVYGLFFFGEFEWKGFGTILKIIACTALQTIVLTLGLTTYFLMPLMNMSFIPLAAMRSFSVLISMAVQLAALIFFGRYMPYFKKVMKR